MVVTQELGRPVWPQYAICHLQDTFEMHHMLHSGRGFFSANWWR